METLDRNLARVPRAQAPLLTWPYLALPDTPTHIGILLNFKQRATADASVPILFNFSTDAEQTISWEQCHWTEQAVV